MKNSAEKVKNFIKLLLLSLLTGLLGGAVGGLFARLITVVTNIRLANGWLILLLPVFAVSIVFIYKKLGISDVGTDDVIKSVNDTPVINSKLSVGIIITSAISHLFGTSPNGKATDSDSVISRFESLCPSQSLSSLLFHY